MPIVQTVEEDIIKYFNLKSINKVTYLGKSDNVTFCIETVDKEKYVLKRHTETSSKNVIESELLWLEALEASNTLEVQRPVRNINNEMITKIIDEKTGSHFYWTLQVWLKGKTLDRQPTDDELKKLAQLMVSLHNHSVYWTVPETFERPYYNADNLLRSLHQIKQTLPVKIMSTDDYKIFQRTADKIIKAIHSQGENRDTWGIIHSDIHEGNYIFNEGKLSIIDFSSCGFGFYLFDIAETCLHLSANNRKMLLTYYQEKRQLQDDYCEIIEAFFIWAIIRNFAFLSQNSDEHNELAKTIPMVVEKFCRKYLKGERFLFN